MIGILFIEAVTISTSAMKTGMWMFRAWFRRIYGFPTGRSARWLIPSSASTLTKLATGLHLDEIRPEVGEGFDPLASLFKQFELVSVVGDERHLVRLRTDHRDEEVYLYRLRARPASVSH